LGSSRKGDLLGGQAGRHRIHRILLVLVELDAGAIPPRLHQPGGVQRAGDPKIDAGHHVHHGLQQLGEGQHIEPGDGVREKAATTGRVPPRLGEKLRSKSSRQRTRSAMPLPRRPRGALHVEVVVLHHP
jgi:hypothetical protein